MTFVLSFKMSFNAGELGGTARTRDRLTSCSAVVRGTERTSGLDVQHHQARQAASDNKWCPDERVLFASTRYIADNNRIALSVGERRPRRPTTPAAVADVGYPDRRLA